MSDRQIVIFTDTRGERVLLLRNRLADEGIEATVINDSLQEGMPLGWSTAMRIVVAPEDQSAAEAVVREFESEDHAIPASDDRVSTAELDERAACPQCHRARTAVCPICQTASASFRLADYPPAPASSDEDHSALLVCSICDEPFEPGYLRRCEWCGHDFGAGLSAVGVESREAPNERTVLVIVAMAIVLAVVFAYFASLAPGSGR